MIDRLRALSKAPNKDFAVVLSSELYPFIGCILGGLILAIIKLKMWDGVDFGRLMWAEDGRIFLKQAVEIGPISLLRPYEGYLHLYPRFVALIGTLMPLGLIPIVFFAGWLLAFLLMIWIACVRAAQSGAGPVLCMAVVILMVTQPHGGEIFFTLTNAQWLCGVTLALLLLVPSHSEKRLWEMILIFVLGLTGPFVVIYLPLLLLQTWLMKRWSSVKTLLLPVLSASIIQIACILSMPRRADGPMSTAVEAWGTALLRFFLFGNETTLGMVAASLFWLLLLVVLARILLAQSSQQEFGALTILIAAFMTFAAGLYAVRASPAILVPMGAGARYFFIPYALIFYLICLLRRTPPRLLAALLAVGFTVNFLAWWESKIPFTGMPGRDERGTSVSLVLAERQNHQLIVVNPSVEWGFRLHKNFQNADDERDIIDLARPNNAELRTMENTVYRYYSISGDPQLVFRVKGICSSDKRVGVEFGFYVDAPGIAQFFWSSSGEFNEINSVKRYFAKGEVSLNVDSPIASKVNFIRFDPREDFGFFDIKSAKVYCINE